MLLVFSYFAYILHFIIIVVVLFRQQFKVDCVIRADWLMGMSIHSRAGGRCGGQVAGGGYRYLCFAAQCALLKSH